MVLSVLFFFSFSFSFSFSFFLFFSLFLFLFFRFLQLLLLLPFGAIYDNDDSPTACWPVLIDFIGQRDRVDLVDLSPPIGTG